MKRWGFLLWIAFLVGVGVYQNPYLLSNQVAIEALRKQRVRPLPVLQGRPEEGDLIEFEDLFARRQRFNPQTQEVKWIVDLGEKASPDMVVNPYTGDVTYSSDQK